MFIMQDNWLTLEPDHFIFEFHLPEYPVVPGAISAGLMHHTYGEHFDSVTTDVDILFLKPITHDKKLKLSIHTHLSELLDSNDSLFVKLCPTKKIIPSETSPLAQTKKTTSTIIRPPELIFHYELSIHDNRAECTLDYEHLLISRPYLSALQYKNYFICLETMGNLAMELCAPNVMELFVFHSFKGVWFDWRKMTKTVTVTTFARRINAKLIQWSSHIINENQELLGYVNKGLNVLSSK